MTEYIPINMDEFNRWLADSGDLTHRVDYDLDENSIVFDLGGYKGDWSASILQKYRSNIYIFEPINQFYEKIASRFNGNPNITVFDFGLGKKDENVEISLTTDSSSIFNIDGEKEQIKICNLSHFLKEKNIHSVDLVKINIEGGEYDLLESMLEYNITMFKNIQVQFHRFVPDCVDRRSNIREQLSKTHELTYDYEFIWENWKLKNNTNE